MGTENRHFLISVIMPVYNVAPYLEEAINSVLDQTIGFDDHIQLILVDDGSTDGSGGICRKYRRSYPRNIICIEKDNGGVSSARNMGMELVQGRYVSFMDSDDVWSRESFQNIIDFFEAHPQVHIASGRLSFMERSLGKKYSLDYVHEKTRVIDVRETPDLPLFSVPRTFFAAELLAGHRFDEKLTYSEDGLFLNEIVLEAGRFGVVRDAVYYYRRRFEENSASDLSVMRKEFYLTTPDQVFRRIMERSVDLYGSVIPYVQYVLISYLRFRLFKRIPDILTEKEKEDYLDSIRSILERIGDEVILTQRNIPLWHKVYELKVKHGTAAYDRMETLHRQLRKRIGMRISAFRIDADGLHVTGEGREKWISADSEIRAVDERNEACRARYLRSENNDKTGIFPDIIIRSYTREFTLPLREGAVYTFFLTGGKGRQRTCRIIYGRRAQLTKMEHSYYAAEGFIIREEGKGIAVERDHFMKKRRMEQQYSQVIRREGGERIASLREKGLTEIKGNRTPIWILSDQTDLTGKNGEAFRRFLDGQTTDRPRLFLLISGEGARPADIPAGSELLPYGSDKHLTVQIAADRVFSSSPDDPVFQPFGKDLKYVRDLISYTDMIVSNGRVDVFDRE